METFEKTTKESGGIQLAKVKFNAQLCKGCGLCVNACPKGILALSGKRNAKGYPVAECTDLSKCIGCGFCYRMCPDCAVEVVDEK